MLLGERTGVWSGKSSPYDRKVEYLKSIGGAYIDTGITASSNFGIKTSVRKDDTSSGFFYGGEVAWVTKSCMLIYLSTRDIRWAKNSWGSIGFTDFKTGQFYDVEQIGFSILVGDKISTVTASSFDSGINVFLFCNDRNGEAQEPANCSIKETTIYNGTVPIMKLTPVVKNNVGYFYDELNPTGGIHGNGIYGNASSSGEFEWGELNEDAVGGGYKLTCVRRSYRRSSRPSARFCATSRRWEVAA